MALESIGRAHLQAQVEAVMDRLTDTQRQVLTLRFGLDRAHPGEHSLTEIAEIVGQGVTPEQVRDVEEDALGAIRGRPSAGHLVYALGCGHVSRTYYTEAQIRGAIADPRSFMGCHQCGRITKITGYTDELSVAR